MAQRSDKTRWESNSFYDLFHPPDICRADGWWDWMSDEGRAGTCWPTISYLCSCRSVRIFPCVLWMWHDSDPNPKQRWRVLDLWCLEARKEREKLRCWKRNLVSGLESRGRSGSDLLVPTPDPRWSRSGRCVHTWCITHSDHLTQFKCKVSN